jgi:dTDP-glucose pyrophosphorylase
MQPTLLILAAGMASRYGSMKQTEGFGPNDETIMEYSLYDAIRTGFKKAVFVIRREFADDFKKLIEPKFKDKIAIEYVYQELSDYMNGFQIPGNREKPWGTAHAVLCGKEVINEPFAVINADDFYGRDGFAKAFDFLMNDCNEKTYSIIGYELLKTLSDHGTVNRGVCEVDVDHNLVSVVERLNVSQKGDKIFCNDEHLPKELPLDTHVSMNFWCFDPSVFDYIKQVFKEFLSDNASNPKTEFFIPIVADKYIKDGEGVIKVIPTSAKWFGVTYKEDAPMVKESLMKLINAGEYPTNLWEK